MLLRPVLQEFPVRVGAVPACPVRHGSGWSSPTSALPPAQLEISDNFCAFWTDLNEQEV